eukprot:TRINITY_DN4496_c2_g3_i2.p1 TRINITY_DN4496_c2_g3~~TRINITY_DN4496_c2_g3_i2.p1  ORF type:complete len:111 (+),score=22.74 TRINITY_DN4496_c2_g3_i2:54-386(+)
MLKLTQCNTSTLLSFMETTFEESVFMDTYGSVDRKYQDFASMCMTLVVVATVVFTVFCFAELTNLWAKGMPEEDTHVVKENKLNDPCFVPFRHHAIHHGRSSRPLPMRRA